MVLSLKEVYFIAVHLMSFVSCFYIIIPALCHAKLYYTIFLFMLALPKPQLLISSAEAVNSKRVYHV